MKRILSLILALITVLCTVTVTAAATSNEPVKQDLNYKEILGKVEQPDSGWIDAEVRIDSADIAEDTPPRSDSGFQFYVIGLERWSERAGGTDAPIDDWYLDWIDESLSALRENGGGCIIRCTYERTGTNSQYPNEEDTWLGHLSQLAEVFSRYPDVINGIHCGLIGTSPAGFYNHYEKLRITELTAWIERTPDSISVYAKQFSDFLDYIRDSEEYNQIWLQVIGSDKPIRIISENYYTKDLLLVAKALDQGRINVYNGALLQDGNDGGYFVGERDNFHTWLNYRRTSSAYGGSLSGAANYFRYGSTGWMAERAFLWLYPSNLSYYNNSSKTYVTAGYRDEYTTVAYYADEDKANEEIMRFEQNCKTYGAGMSYKAEQNCNRVIYKTPKSQTTEESFETYALAVAAAEQYNTNPPEEGATATPQAGVTYTTGGWSDVTFSKNLINSMVEKNGISADLTDYVGQSAAKFFEEHIGYRPVLRESYLSAQVPGGGVLRIEGTVDNTGFGTVPDGKVSEVVMTDGTNLYTVKTDLDASEWSGGSRNEYALEIKLPGSIPAGEYQVYLRIANESPTGITALTGSVRFANAGEDQDSLLYRDEAEGNYLGSFTVTAERIPASDESCKQVNTTFLDVANDYWGEDAITQICSLGLMNGISKTSFNPTGTTTRAQFVTVLYNMDGRPELSEQSIPFTDVSEGRYYSAPVAWAYTNGIVLGTSDTAFTPDGKLTREQFATMLYRYAKHKERDVSATADLTRYTDADQVSGYALDAVKWANAEGYITGVSETLLKPKSYANRAQMATILIRYLQNASN